MSGNYLLRRKLWYIKKRNAGRVRFLFKAAAAVVIIVLIMFNVHTKTIPAIAGTSAANIESKIQHLVLKSVNSIILDSSRIKIELLHASFEEKGNGILKTDYSRLNNLASIIDKHVETEIINAFADGINISLDSVTGIPVNTGKYIKIKLLDLKKIKSEFRCDYFNSGDSLKTTLIVEVSVNLIISTLYQKGEVETVTTIPLMETFMPGIHGSL